MMRSAILNAELFAKKVEKDCAEFMTNNKIDQGSKLANFPWDSLLSDHLARRAHFTLGQNQIKVTTMNTLNPAYVNWLKPRLDKDSAEDLSQRLWWIFSQDITEESLRINRIVAQVIKDLNNGFVVCLQEVGSELVVALDAVLQREPAMEVECCKSYFETEPDSKYNQNLILYDKRFYKKPAASERIIHMPDLRIPDNSLPIVQLVPHTDDDSGIPFNIVNVHVSWKKNDNYAALFKKVFANKQLSDESNQFTIICGDFNCSSRYPDRNHGTDHIMASYKDDCFGFAAYTDATPEYTHVNTMENAKSTYDQLDCFDYIMVMNHPDQKKNK